MTRPDGIPAGRGATDRATPDRPGPDQRCPDQRCPDRPPVASAGPWSRRGFLLGAVAAAVGATAFALSSCGLRLGRSAYTLASGEPGGTYVEFGELLQAAVQRRGAFDLGLRATDGSVENLALLAAGEVHLALSLADAVDPASPDLVAIGQVYQNYLQCVVRADSGIEHLAELGDRRVSVGAPGSGAAMTGHRVLDAAGLDSGAGAAQSSERGIQDATAALASGAIDALFWSSGIPAPAIVQLGEQLPIRFLPLADVLPELDAAHPDTYESTALPRGTYGLTHDVPTIGTPNLLLARRDLPGAVAADLVDVLIGEAETLVPADTVGVQYLTTANLIDTAPLPLHPAAAARYRERYG